jgi:hypothetical protein
MSKKRKIHSSEHALIAKAPNENYSQILPVLYQEFLCISYDLQKNPNRVEDELLKLNARSKKIALLDLSRIGFGDYGTKFLIPIMRALKLKDSIKITTLDLSYNNLGDAGIGLLCHAMQSQFLISNLNLAGNYITDAGVSAIATINEHMLELDLSCNTIQGHSYRLDSIMKSFLGREKPLNKINFVKNSIEQPCSSKICKVAMDIAKKGILINFIDIQDKDYAHLPLVEARGNLTEMRKYFKTLEESKAKIMNIEFHNNKDQVTILSFKYPIKPIAVCPSMDFVEEIPEAWGDDCKRDEIAFSVGAFQPYSAPFIGENIGEHSADS